MLITTEDEKLKEINNDLCFYCGELSTSIDHVIPQSLLERLRLHGDFKVSEILNHRNRIKTVPACKECNCLLSNSYFKTLAERKAYLKRRLRNRNRKLLNMPTWTDSELGTLSGRLRQYVIGEQIKKERLMARLEY